MTSIDAYIYIIIGLLGVAYPILLQVIARLDEKYSSENVVALFNSEWEGRVFRYSLISSLMCICIWTVRSPALISIVRFNEIIDINKIINNSAALLIAVNTIVLVVGFFLFVRKILIYYTPKSFIQYLIKEHSETKDDFKYFTILSDILLLSIRNQQRNVSLTLSYFFYDAFKQERDKSSEKPVVYPELYYETVHKAIEELAILREKRNYSLEYRTAGGIWLLGEMQNHIISEETYKWLWRNLTLVIQYEQDDMIVYHWETADQYSAYSIPQIEKKYNYRESDFPINMDIVDMRELERKRFMEFHYMLGGLLTYMKRYNCIRRLFNHTNSEPPKYELLPSSMNEVFRFFFHMRDPHDMKHTWISNQYPFIKQSGLNADSVIKKWVCTYTVILFLRQYTIIPYLTITRPLDYPEIPNTQNEINEWIAGIDFFRKLLLECLDNKELMKELGLEFITQEWCTENAKPYPTTFIDTFKERLEKAYTKNSMEQKVSQEKVNLFNQDTKDILETSIRSAQIINNEHDTKDFTDIWIVKGLQTVYDKDSFTENPEHHVMNLNSILSLNIQNTLFQRIASTFQIKKTTKYLLKEEDIFAAIDKLDIDHSYIIILVGVDVSYFIDYLKVGHLEIGKYRNIDIIKLEDVPYINSSFYILNKDDLPFISTQPIAEDVINKYSLVEISKDLNLYTSIIDFNNEVGSDIFNAYKQRGTDEELRKQVLISIIISIEIKWKKEVEIVQLVQYSEYIQKGLPNELSDVKPFKKKK